MSSDLRPYEVLGVKPGVSPAELKAAHRDLAKVWHPDRFGHDPRLQAKAQEKLKEINEAYEQLISGKTPRPVNPTPRQEERAYSAPSRRGSSWRGIAVALLLFVAVFAVATTALLQNRKQHAVQEQEEPVKQAASVEQGRATRPDANTRAEVSDSARKPTREGPEPESTPAQTVIPEPPPALPTVTVVIDPESGLLAKADCPVRSRMTYPSGSQPTGYCNISHAPPPKGKKIDRITKFLR